MKISTTKIDKRILFLIVLGIIVFGLRLSNIQESIYDDEANYAYSLTVMDNLGFNHDFSSPFLFNLLYKPFILLFGLKTWVFRLIPWLFGILNTILVYFMTTRLFGKRAAFWSVVLMLVSFYPTLAALQLDAEGSIIMFFALLFFIAYVESCQSDQQKRFFWQMIAGISLGLAIVTKYNAVCLVLISLAYSFFLPRKIEHQPFRDKVKIVFGDVFFIYLVGFIIFIAALLLGIIVSPQHWLEFVPIISWQDGFGDDYRPQLISSLGIIMFFLWSTPLLFGSYILSLFQDRSTRRKLLLPLTWVSMTLLFYTVGMTYGSMDRYFMHTIPALAAMGGFIIAKMNWSRRHLTLGFTSGILSLGLFFLLNSFPLVYVPRVPSLYLQQLRSLNINFLFSFTSASGPTFGVSFATIFFALFCSLSALGLFFLFKKRKFSLYFLVLFFSVSLSFNLFLVSEYLFHPTGVAVSDIKWEMIHDLEKRELPSTIYSTDSGILWYFDHRYRDHRDKIVGLPNDDLERDYSSLKKMIISKGGTALVVYWPPLSPQSPLFDLMKSCMVEKQFYSQKVLIGEIYSCPK